MVQREVPAASEDTAQSSSVCEPSAQELTELQQVVAEIVARDIERLCQEAGANAYR